MKGIQLEDQLEQIEFAKRAAAHFAKEPKHSTFTDKAIASGCLFAPVQWMTKEDLIELYGNQEEGINE